MTGKAQIQQLIAPAEAMELFRYAGVQEMRIAKDLHDLYRAQKGRHSDSFAQGLRIGKEFADWKENE